MHLCLCNHSSHGNFSLIISMDGQALLTICCTLVALVVAAVRRSVIRWRTRGVTCTLPGLVDGAPDVQNGVGERPAMQLITRPICSVLVGRARCLASVPQWAPSCRGHLLSAITGGQWT